MSISMEEIKQARHVTELRDLYAKNLRIEINNNKRYDEIIKTIEILKEELDAIEHEIPVGIISTKDSIIYEIGKRIVEDIDNEYMQNV